MDFNKRRVLILQYIQANPESTAWDIAKKLIADKKFKEADFGKIRSAATRLMKNPDSDKDVTIKITEEKPRYQVIGDKYFWESKHGNINLPVEFIDQLFYEYSEHGLNLSQTEIINKHNLKIWEWNSIKSTLWLYKKANIFSPHTVEITPPDQLDTMIADKIGKMISNTGYQVEKQFQKQLNKHYKDVIKKQYEKDLIIQAMITELYDSLPVCGVQPVIKVAPDGNGTINVFIFDIHFGARTRIDRIEPYSPEIVQETLLHIAEVVNGYGAKEVNVFFGGDMIEAFTGLNHPDAWKGLEKGYYGAKVVMELYKTMVVFLSAIHNVQNVFGVPGNHDRATEKKDIDGEGYVAEILFELVKLAFKDKLNVKYDQKIISESIDGVQYIMTHGHLKMTDVTPAELILDYGDPYKFNLLVSGHWHERRVKKDHKNFRQIVCPSIFPGNDYSLNNGWSVSPGFLIAMNSQYNGKPTIIDHPL